MLITKVTRVTLVSAHKTLVKSYFHCKMNFAAFNPIFDGVWHRCRTLQLFTQYYSKIIHPTHPVIPYIWSHDYPLQLRPTKCFKMSNVLELHNL